MAGSIIDPTDTFYPVIAKETSAGSGKYVLSIQRSGQNGGSEMTYPGSSVNGDYHEVEGMSTWPEHDAGRSVMCSRGTLAAPLPPEPVQIGQQQVLGRNTGDVTSMTVNELMALNGELDNIYEVETLTAAHADFVLTADSVTSLGVLQADRYKWKPPGVTIGTTAPATTDKPGLWLYDNGVNVATELYYYDPNRSKWLSTRTYTLEFDVTSSVASTVFVDMPVHGTCTTTIGHGTADDYVWVGYDQTVMTAGGHAGFELELTLDGAALAVPAKVVMANDAVGIISKDGQDFVVDAGGGVIGARNSATSGGASGTKVSWKLHFRRTQA